MNEDQFKRLTVAVFFGVFWGILAASLFIYLLIWLNKIGLGDLVSGSLLAFIVLLVRLFSLVPGIVWAVLGLFLLVILAVVIVVALSDGMSEKWQTWRGKKKIEAAKKQWDSYK